MPAGVGDRIPAKKAGMIPFLPAKIRPVPLARLILVFFDVIKLTSETVGTRLCRRVVVNKL